MSEHVYLCLSTSSSLLLDISVGCSLNFCGTLLISCLSDKDNNIDGTTTGTNEDTAPVLDYGSTAVRLLYRNYIILSCHDVERIGLNCHDNFDILSATNSPSSHFPFIVLSVGIRAAFNHRF